MTDGPALIDIDRLLPYLPVHLCVTVAVSVRQSSLWFQGAPSHLYRVPCKGVLICAFGFTLGSSYTINCWLATIIKDYCINKIHNKQLIAIICWQILRHFIYKDFACITALESHVWQWKKPFTPRFVCSSFTICVYVFRGSEKSSMDYNHWTL